MQIELARKLARTERAQFLVEGVDLEEATAIPEAEWEPFQLAHLNDDGLLRHERKSRQVGWSFTIAAEGVAVAHLYPRTTALFLSINREESAEKIRYAKAVYEALYPPWRQPLVSDNLTGLAFANGSRLISLPQRAARGKDRAWIYLDEFAHYRLDRDIYRGTLPVTTKGGRLRMGSSPMGARGTFWEIGDQRLRPYPGYVRSVTPWYATSALLLPEWRHRLREVTRLAAAMNAAEAVERFGNERIREIYANSPEDDFAQEYLCEYIDEAAAYITWDDIAACTSDGEGTLGWCAFAADVEGGHDAIDALAEQVRAGVIRGQLCWGLDIGRKKDLTELCVVEVIRPKGELQALHVVRLLVSLGRQNFAAQEELCRHLLEHTPVVRGMIDSNGLGMQLAETLHLRDGYGERSLPVTFHHHVKSLMATHLKTRFQHRGRGGILIPNHRDLKYQVHSVRRRVTASGNLIFDVEHSERHHADKFWALALANEAGETVERVDAYPVADSLTIRTTQSLDPTSGRGAEPVAPDLGDPYTGYGLTAEQLSVLIEQGVGAVLARQRPGAGVVVDAD